MALIEGESLSSRVTTASVGWSLSGGALDSEHGPSRVFQRAAVHVRRRGHPSMFVSYCASGRTTGIVIDSCHTQLPR